MEEKLFTRKEAWGIYLTTILGCSMVGAGLCMKSYQKGRRNAFEEMLKRIGDFKEGYEAGKNERTDN